MNTALMINSYGRSSTTLTGTFLTLSSGLKTSGSSHNPEIVMGGVALLVGLAA